MQLTLRCMKAVEGIARGAGGRPRHAPIAEANQAPHVCSLYALPQALQTFRMHGGSMLRADCHGWDV
jgi:hypothetical protein